MRKSTSTVVKRLFLREPTLVGGTLLFLTNGSGNEVPSTRLNLLLLTYRNEDQIVVGSGWRSNSCTGRVTHRRRRATGTSTPGTSEESTTPFCILFRLPTHDTERER